MKFPLSITHGWIVDADGHDVFDSGPSDFMEEEDDEHLAYFVALANADNERAAAEAAALVGNAEFRKDIGMR